MANPRFAVNEQRRAVFACEFDGIDAVDVQAAVFGFEEILYFPGCRVIIEED